MPIEEQLAEIGNSWVQVKFKVDLLGTDVTPLVQAFLSWASAVGLRYVFGSLSLQLNREQFTELKSKFGANFDFTVLPSGELITEDNWTAYSEALFEAALKNNADAVSSQQFYDDFTRLFVLTSRNRTFSLRREYFDDIKLYCVRFSHKIEELSGLQVVVPKLSEHNSRTANAAEMMRSFISIYPAYAAYCRNTRNANKFYWDYTVDIDGFD